MAISVVSFLFSRAAQPEARGPTLLGVGFLYRILSPTVLQTHWLPVFTELYNSSIAHSISLEWHVWSSSSGNNCHVVHRSLSSGASVYDCTMGFYLAPYCQPSPLTRFLPITAIEMCHFLPVHHLGMAFLAGSKVNIQHTSSLRYKNLCTVNNFLVLFLFPLAHFKNIREYLTKFHFINFSPLVSGDLYQKSNNSKCPQYSLIFNR